MNLNKDPSSWARISPDIALSGRREQQINVLKMAIEDIGKQDAEIARLQEAKRKWRLVADERSKENCALRQLLRDARDDVRPDVLARIDAALLEQN